MCGVNGGTITGCYNTGTVSGNGENVGGVCGVNGGTITSCYNTESVSGDNYVGGVCGFNTNGGTITGCYNKGSVSGSNGVGGVCGVNEEGTITGDCGEKSDNEFRNGTVCTLLNTALKNANASVRFYMSGYYPELFMNVPSLVDDVYQISNKEELYAFALLVNKNVETSANAVLTANITVNTGVLKEDGTLADNYSGFEIWTPIGKDQNPYTGTFDGQGHTISGLYFNDVDASYVGLFGGNCGTIKNVGVVDSYFCGSSYVGGVCGGNVAQNKNTSITNCYNTGAVSGSSYVGGVCGGIQVESNFTATITNCYYNSEKYTGNAVGDNNGTVTKVEGKTTAQFKSGEVAYLLSQGSEGSVWGQQLGTDDYPVLSDYKVIKAAKGDKDANNNDTYWATFSNRNSDATLLVPLARNLTVYNATVSSGTMTLKKRTDNQVAKGEGVLLKTDGEYVNAKANATDGLTAVDYAYNNLVATPATEETINAETGYKLYRLTYNNSTAKTGLGFYLGVVKDENGTVINNGSQLKATPNKAYLNVSTDAATTPTAAAPAQGFVFPGDDETTGIGEIVIEGDAGTSGSANADGRIYNLQGQQVTAPVKGLYIKNNKKVVIK
ncbi:MAG: GLUG motif-containing protein [Prevotellaceae bacterium]|nr:GLUG motif-containing protein [Prevotellaceae bacterium]